MNSKKLLIVTSTFPKSVDDTSSARFVFDLAQALAEYYEVHVLSPHSPNSLKEDIMGRVKVHRFLYFFPEYMQGLTQEAGIMANLKRNKLLFFQLPFLFISEIFNIIKIVKREDIDIINSHWIVPQGLAVGLVKRYLKVKHVVTIHAAGIFTLKRWKKFGQNLARYIVSRSDLVFPVSGYIKETLDSLVSNTKYNYEILPMGVQFKNFNKDKVLESGLEVKEKKSLNLLFVGKLVEKKGLKHLLEALSILRDREISVKLTIAGNGPLETELKSYVSMKNLDSNVVFCGWTPNDKLSEFYSASDITVVPSIYDKKGETEGMPVVVLESLAMGTPVLGSKISGIPDIIKDGVNGWLVDYASSEALAVKIQELSKVDLNNFSQVAVETASNYTYEIIASKYKDRINSLFK